MAKIIKTRAASDDYGPVKVTVFDGEPSSEQLAKVTGMGLSAEWANGSMDTQYNRSLDKMGYGNLAAVEAGNRRTDFVTTLYIVGVSVLALALMFGCVALAWKFL